MTIMELRGENPTTDSVMAAIMALPFSTGEKLLMAFKETDEIELTELMFKGDEYQARMTYFVSVVLGLTSGNQQYQVTSICTLLEYLSNFCDEFNCGMVWENVEFFFIPID